MRRDGGVKKGGKVRGTAAEWENWMVKWVKGAGGSGTREKEKSGGGGEKGRGSSLFSVRKINYFYVFAAC